ncbi:hypothetical protein PRZ48_008741 [Zasmidium cellare]|uniref:Uncharacterized protein n=1 Tax=Zasmidium cellare TaxID=395010 RepID=A0ABR0EGB1_ZASCE|nr:hypothetical protein PRZ48_008741 [Zasmidium cellare]
MPHPPCLTITPPTLASPKRTSPTPDHKTHWSLHSAHATARANLSEHLHRADFAFAAWQAAKARQQRPEATPADEITFFEEFDLVERDDVRVRWGEFVQASRECEEAMEGEYKARKALEEFEKKKKKGKGKAERPVTLFFQQLRGKT